MQDLLGQLDSLRTRSAFVLLVLRKAPDFLVGVCNLLRAERRISFGGPAFEALLRGTMTELESRNPERMHSFLRAGSTHTFLLTDLAVSVEGVAVGDWVGRFIGQQDDWDSVSD